MASILTEIEKGMATAIAGMRESKYNYDWHSESVNQPDMAKVTFPTAEIFLESEESLDTTDGAWSQTYFNDVIFRIDIRAQLTEETEIPLWEINAALNKALDDLKKLFGINYSVSGYCDFIMYQGMERIEEQNGDILIPKRMLTRWKVRYTQDRQNPETVAN